MSRSFDPPPLTPQFCFNQTALRDFLRLARNSIDDSITQNLNALLQPGETPWDPGTTSSRQVAPPGRKRQIDSASCASFKERILFPAWNLRSEILTYCGNVATSPDPNDPDTMIRGVEDARARERIVDERLDPYSGRYFPREARTEALAATVRQERMVEGIIRARTWGIVGERCLDQTGGWEEEFERWRRKKKADGEGGR